MQIPYTEAAGSMVQAGAGIIDILKGVDTALHTFTRSVVWGGGLHTSGYEGCGWRGRGHLATVYLTIYLNITNFRSRCFFKRQTCLQSIVFKIFTLLTIVKL